jgi:hypothetical protein
MSFKYQKLLVPLCWFLVTFAQLQKVSTVMKNRIVKAAGRRMI